MLQLFYGRKGGVISVMLVIILVPVMALGTSLVELSKKRSADTIWSEAVDSAASSMLADYDETLYKRFGLLAMVQSDQDKDSSFNQTFQEYLNANLGGSDSVLSTIMSLKEADVEKLYSLNNNAVLKQQIMEFSKTRTPVSLGLDGVDQLISSLKENFEGMFGVIDAVSDACDALKKVFDSLQTAAELEKVRMDIVILVTQYDEKKYKTKCEDKINEISDEIKKYQDAQNVLAECADGVKVPSMDDYENASKSLLNLFVEGNKIKEEYQQLATFFVNHTNNNDSSVSLPNSGEAKREWDTFVEEYASLAEEDTTLPKDFQEYVLEKKNFKNWKNFWVTYGKEVKKASEAQSKLATARSNVEKKLGELYSLVERWETAMGNLAAKMTELQTKVEAVESATTSVGTAVTKAGSSITSAYENLSAEDNETEEKKRERRQEANAVKAVQDVTASLSDSYDSFIDVVKTVEFYTCQNKLNQKKTKIGALKTAVGNFQNDIEEYLKKKSPCAEIKNALNAEGMAENSMLGSGIISTVLDNGALGTVANALVDSIVSMIKSFIKDIANIVRLLSNLLTCPTYDSRYKINLDAETRAAINDTTAKTSSIHDAEDRQTAEREQNETQSVADDLGYDLSQLGPDGASDEGNQIGTIIENIKSDLEKLFAGYESIRGGQNGFQKVLSAIGTMVFPIAKIVQVIVTIVTLFSTVKDLVGQVGNLVTTIISQLGSFIYQSLLLNFYVTGMFTNRTTPYGGDTTLMQTKFSKVAYHGGKQDPVSDWKDIWTVGSTSDEGSVGANFLKFLGTEVSNALKTDDCSFAMAEAEYIFAGEESEAANQTIVYLWLLFIRAVSNIGAAVGNEIAASLGPFYPVGVIIVLVVETVLDMVFLTNGVGVPLIKYAGNSYVSSGNLKTLLKKVESVVTNNTNSVEAAISIADAIGDKKEYMDKLQKKAEISEAFFKEDLRNKTGTSNPYSGEKEHEQAKNEELDLEKQRKSKIKNLEVSYEQYLWFLLMWVPESDKLDRIGNVVTMEMRQAYKETEGISDYRLSKSYTYLRICANANWKPLMPIPNSVVGYDIGTLHPKEQLFYRGY